MKKVLVTTLFAQSNPRPLELLKSNGFEVELCPPNRKFTLKELEQRLPDCDAAIIGTEKWGGEMLDLCPKLKLLARVGIGIDSVDFQATQKRGVVVTYTPDAPSLSVAELTLGLILDLARGISLSSDKIRKGSWERYTGHLLAGKTIGIFGFGRIGPQVAQFAQSFNMKVLVNEIDPSVEVPPPFERVSKEELLVNSDFVTLHIPRSDQTLNFLSKAEFSSMKDSAVVINTARGGIIDEDALVDALKNKVIAGAALDVFAEEPFNTESNHPLAEFSNVIMTAHMGSCTHKSRLDMEYGAAESIVDFFNGNPLKNEARP